LIKELTNKCWASTVGNTTKNMGAILKAWKENCNETKENYEEYIMRM
jgi:hypothetical protein